MSLSLDSTHNVPPNDRTYNVFTKEGVSPSKCHKVCGTLRLYITLYSSVYMLVKQCQTFLLYYTSFVTVDDNCYHVDNNVISDIMKTYTTYREVLWC